jgi:hypothetical protein
MGKRKCVFNVKHSSAINATASANIRDLFKAKDGNNINSDLECAAKEATFSYHTARHELKSVSKHQTAHLN